MSFVGASKANLPPRRATIDFGVAKKYRNPALFKEFFEGTNKKLLKQTNGVDTAELDFLKCYSELLHQNKTPFVESVPQNIYLSNRVEEMKQKKALPISGDCLAVLQGPNIDRGIEHEQPQYFQEQLAAQTISTYPLRGNNRQGDPICDRYGFGIYENGVISVVADGCNWGERPKWAAEKCRNTVLDYLKRNISSMTTIPEAQSHLLRAFTEAQRTICADDPESPGPGSTTLLAGVLLEIKSGANSDWVFVCASVGDCKAFLIEHDPLKVRDLTNDNRIELTGDTDCGGRLGAVFNGTADLRNLRTYCVPCRPYDIIMVVSDGVHDNFHPEMLSVTPNDLKLDFASWQEASSVINIEEVAAKYRVQFMSHLLSELEELTPLHIVNSVIKHCIDVTFASRDWMENNPGQILPKDYEKYPGKMDHTTCAAFRVGHANWFVERKKEATASEPYCSPLLVSLYTTASTVRLCCRTIAKGKFECVAKKHSCLLKIIPRDSFSVPEGETIIGSDEIAAQIRREIKFPQGVNIDIHSKQVSCSKDTGVISIMFTRL